MSKEKIHPGEKQEPTQKIPEKKQEHTLSLTELRNTLPPRKENPIIGYLDMFDKTWKKRKRIIQSGEALFEPGDDPHMYLVTKWVLVILRETSSGEKREIGTVYPGSFMGEGILFGRNRKDVSAIAKTYGVEAFAVTKKDIDALKDKEPKAMIDLYEYVIEVTNKRLLDTGEELATIYEATNSLSNLAELTEKWEADFSDLLQELKGLMGVDYIIFVEQHPAIPGLFAYKYDTKNTDKKPINQKAGVEINTNLSGMVHGTTIRWVWAKDAAYALPLKQWEQLKGFFILGKEKGLFTDNQIRVYKNLSLSLASIVDANQKRAENKLLQAKKLAC